MQLELRTSVSCPTHHMQCSFHNAALSFSMCRRLVDGHAMYTVAPTRPELPIISMPMMVGDAGGFTPRYMRVLMWTRAHPTAE